MLAGSAQDCTRIVREFCLTGGQGAGATVFGKDPVKLSAEKLRDGVAFMRF